MTSIEAGRVSVDVSLLTLRLKNAAAESQNVYVHLALENCGSLTWNKNQSATWTSSIVTASKTEGNVFLAPVNVFEKTSLIDHNPSR